MAPPQQVQIPGQAPEETAVIPARATGSAPVTPDYSQMPLRELLFHTLSTVQGENSRARIGRELDKLGENDRTAGIVFGHFGIDPQRGEIPADSVHSFEDALKDRSHFQVFAGSFHPLSPQPGLSESQLACIHAALVRGILHAVAENHPNGARWVARQLNSLATPVFTASGQTKAGHLTFTHELLADAQKRLDVNQGRYYDRDALYQTLIDKNGARPELHDAIDQLSPRNPTMTSNTHQEVLQDLLRTYLGQVVRRRPSS